MTDRFQAVIKDNKLVITSTANPVEDLQDYIQNELYEHFVPKGSKVTYNQANKTLSYDLSCPTTLQGAINFAQELKFQINYIKRGPHEYAESGEVLYGELLGRQASSNLTVSNNNSTTLTRIGDDQYHFSFSFTGTRAQIATGLSNLLSASLNYLNGSSSATSYDGNRLAAYENGTDNTNNNNADNVVRQDEQNTSSLFTRL